ncbi:hypothetical protein Shyd_19190 [Streptomyces hydrogenans]|uniref:Uncharacterized protein n=1 Tax=Streptomyces hydrogenans TaxID=1873719 RepID=A0ABQ3P696_9ACTN|nr:hypothetical protein Shyd_19190 [Streptomyces hydrogenans]
MAWTGLTMKTRAWGAVAAVAPGEGRRAPAAARVRAAAARRRRGVRRAVMDILLRGGAATR